MKDREDFFITWKDVKRLAPGAIIAVLVMYALMWGFCLAISGLSMIIK